LLWIAIEPVRNTVLEVYHLSRHRNMLVAESFLSSLIEIYGRQYIPFFHSVMLFTSNVRSLGLGSENLFITLSVNYRASSGVDSLMP
jgi:transposase-like protein